MQRDGDGLLLVLQQLHLHIVRAERERDRRCRIHRRDIVDDLLAGGNLGAGDHLVAVRLHLVDTARRFGTEKPMWFAVVPIVPPVGFWSPEEDEHVRELDDLGVVCRIFRPCRRACRPRTSCAPRCRMRRRDDGRRRSAHLSPRSAAPTMAMLRRRGTGRAQRALTCVSCRLLESRRSRSRSRGINRFRTRAGRCRDCRRSRRTRVEEQHAAGDDGAGPFEAAAARLHAVDGLELLVGVEGPEDRCRPCVE